MGEQTTTQPDIWKGAAAALLSDQALWIYSWAGLALAMAVLAASVYYQAYVARKLRSTDFLRRWRGARPRKPEKIQKRIDDLNRFRRRKILHILALMLGILTAGAAIPGSLLAAIAVWQEWFLPGPAALLIDGTPFTPAEAGFRELVSFIADQALRGGLADTLEVYKISFTRLESNPDNVAYSALVVLYRVIAGTVAATMLYVLGIVMLGIRNVDKTIRALDAEKLKAMQAA